MQKGAITMPRHQFLFPVGDAKGPCESEVHLFSLFVSQKSHVQLWLVSVQTDGRVVAHLIGNIFRLDARRAASQNYTMDVLRSDGRPLAFFKATGPFQYSAVGMFVLTEFFAASRNFPIMSAMIGVKKAADVDAVLDLKFPQYVPVFKCSLSVYPAFKLMFEI